MSVSADKNELFSLVDLEESYSTTLARLNTLDSSSETPPSLDKVQLGFTDKDVVWLLQRAHEGVQDRLVIAPKLGKLSFQQFCEDVGLDETRPYDARYIPKDASRHNRGESPDGFSVGMILGDTDDPLGRAGIEAHDGLVFLNRSHYQQSRDLKKEQKQARQSGIDIQPMSVMEFTYSDAWIDNFTTRFIHLGTPNTFTPGNGLPIIQKVVCGFIPGGNPGTIESDRDSRGLSVDTHAFAKSETTGIRRILRFA